MNHLAKFEDAAWDHENYGPNLSYSEALGRAQQKILEVMKALCDEDTFENVAVVTTMCAKQCNREQELQDIYLYDMLEKGSQIINHNQCQTLAQRRASAKNSLARAFETWKDTQITIQVQHEMVDLSVTLKTDLRREGSRKTHTQQSKIFERRLRGVGNLWREGRDTAAQVSRYTSGAARLRNPKDARRKQPGPRRHAPIVTRDPPKETLREKEEEYRAKELEYHARHLDKREEDLKQRERDAEEHQASIRILETAQSALAYERETFSELARQGYQQITQLQEVNRQQHGELREAKRRDRLLEEELEKLRLEVKDLRQETESKLETTEKVKHEWAGPLLQGLATGGLGLVGTCITAGMLYCVQ
ncbi:hypothetical protein O1611_g5626 [Lasiodiplodia mahajangana]|uniref:Uncharacterized protein n=1 Tax=Lasiodiplodia mahajangana TaxID=1108764 RepID=A0ACC2JL74_9PEZI|nr:hypothetical protein O1611_g5626 [Lasiodiplodia mahajangana]